MDTARGLSGGITPSGDGVSAPPGSEKGDKCGMNGGKKGLVLLLAAALILGCTPVPAAAESESSLRSQLAQLEKQEKELRNRAEASKKDLANQQRYLEDLNAQVDNIARQADLLGAEVDRLDAAIAEKDRLIEEKAAAAAALGEDVAAKRRDLGAKLQRISQTGGFTDLQLLFDADSYVEYLVKSECVRRITEKDQADMAALEQDIGALNAQKAALEEARQAVSAARAEAETLRRETDRKRQDLTALCGEAQAVLEKLEKDQNRLQQSLKENLKMQADMDKKIAELNKKPSEVGPYKGGTMFWPVPTVHTLSDPFGVLRGGKPHKGIDIANHPTIPIYGEKIVAAADGKVLTAFTANTNGGGYGYHVIIDHGVDARGRRITTLYAHMSAVHVKTGQTVKGGETVLGKAGRTGRVTGPHLHFEVRVNNVCVDPFANGYLKR